MNLTQHAEKRTQQRGINRDGVAFAMTRGKCIHKQGMLFYVVLAKHIKAPREEQFRNLVVLCATDGTVVTTYKNPNASKNIKRATKKNLKKRRFY